MTMVPTKYAANSQRLTLANGITFWVAVDIDNVEILNAQEPDQVKHIFKPWDMRLDEEKAYL